MNQLTSGVYSPKTSKTVTVWLKPDANGDGPELYRDVTDPEGRYIGREFVRDGNGEIVHEYLPPPGFHNVPNSAQEPCYVRVDGNGRVLRDANGYAYGIEPGAALVEHADGSTELLRGDWAQYRFGLAHDPADGGEVPANGNGGSAVVNPRFAATGGSGS